MSVLMHYCDRWLSAHNLFQARMQSLVQELSSSLPAIKVSSPERSKLFAPYRYSSPERETPERKIPHPPE